MFKALIPTSALHLIAHVSACASYKLGSVSFMQVVKAGEPACSVILLSLFFGRKYSKLVWLTPSPSWAASPPGPPPSSTSPWRRSCAP